MRSPLRHITFAVLFFSITTMVARAGGMETNHNWVTSISGHPIGLWEQTDVASRAKTTFTTIHVGPKRLRIHYPIEIVAAGIVGAPLLLIVGWILISKRRSAKLRG